MNWYSHTTSRSGRIGLLSEHLESVANTAEHMASKFGAGEEVRVAGLFHDLGKYSALFQARLRGEVSGLDHWSVGAWAALTRYRESALAAVLAIQGHHTGLVAVDRPSLISLEPEKLRSGHPLGLRVPDETTDQLLERMQSEIGDMSGTIASPLIRFEDFARVPAQAMFSTRMLFSALVDADFIETEAHFQAESATEKRRRKAGPCLAPQEALAQLLKHIEKLKTLSRSSGTVQEVRETLLNDCMEAANAAPSIFTLTAPTGAGKTLSALAFALKHASLHNLDRIIVVLPYLSLIEQTVAVYHSVFSNNSNSFVLEDHSLTAEYGDGNDDRQDGYGQQARLLAENWDAPIVITTSVRFLESLFANRSSACRKLHNVAKSVVIMDEIQTLPLALTIPTLATLSHLATRFGSTIVFSTATQPAFDHLDEHVRKLSMSGWQPTEVVNDAPQLFSVMKRTVVTVEKNALSDWDQLAEKTASESQVLYIVNLKRHALSLLKSLRSTEREGLLHLSTNMCPAHRRRVLSNVHQRLQSNRPCHLVSTQCVEAGVDIDFPTVYRAMAPLDSIVQAAGRCNRNGRAALGQVHVFRAPTDGKGLYPSGYYQQAAGVTELVLKNRGTSVIDVGDIGLFDEYYRTLYSFARPEEIGTELQDAIRSRDFRETAKVYRIIPKNTISVLVPYDMDVYNDLVRQARSEEGIDRKWIHRARPFAVGIYRTDQEDSRLEQVTLRRTNEVAPDWKICLDTDAYDDTIGLNLQNDDLLIA